MRISLWSRSTLQISVAAALLGGCSGTTQAGVPSIAQQSAPRSARANACYAWMDPSATRNDLLYVSNWEGQNVTVYGWRSGRQLGTISCFYQPTSLCVDREQNVYVPDLDTGNITVFAHGGAAPIKTLTDNIGYPSDCAVDRETGDVAVVNSYDGLDPVGSLLIYPHGKQSPREYRSLWLQNYLNDAYDGAGNCYVLGWYESRVMMSELPAGGRELKKIDLKQTIGDLGGVHWDGKYLVVGDVDAKRLYQFTIRGSRARLVHSIALNETGRIFQFWMPKFGPGIVDPQPKRIVAVDWDADRLFKWAYPKPGAPLQTYTTGMAEPNAVALSKAK